MQIRLTNEGEINVDFGDIKNLCKFLGYDCYHEPKYLYRFGSVNDNLLASLEENYLWFSRPLDFNDPLDCKVLINHDASALTILPKSTEDNKEIDHEFIESAIKRFDGVLVSESLEYLNKYRPSLDSLIKNPSPQSIEKAASYLNYAHRAKKIDREMGVCCFTTDPKNILMWSHYGAQHKGVCIKYRRIRSKSGIGSNTFPVKYNKTVPRLHSCTDDLRNEVKIIFLTLLSKSSHWEYENEWRAISPFGHGKHHVDTSDVLEIIFGVNIQDVDIARIVKVIDRQEYRHVKLKQLKLSFDSYKLHLVDYKT